MYIFIHVLILVTLLALDSLSLADCYLVERESTELRTDIGIKLLPAVGVSLLSKTHSLFMSHSNDSVMHTSIRACFLYFFYNPYISLLIQIPFTCYIGGA